MSDIMRPIPFSQLMNWIIEEHKTQDAIFGVRKICLLYTSDAADE